VVATLAEAADAIEELTGQEPRISGQS
jgi:hypothetical protein